MARGAVYCVVLALFVGLLLQLVPVEAVANSPETSPSQTIALPPPDSGEILTALASRPQLNVTISNGVRVSIPLTPTTVGLLEEDGNYTFLPRLSPSRIRAAAEWFAVLRGVVPESGVSGVVILRPDSYDVIVNLPSGKSIRAHVPAASAISAPVEPPSPAGANLAHPSFFKKVPTGISPNGTPGPSWKISARPVLDGEESGSIRVSKHIWTPDHQQAIDPVNAMFYHDTQFLHQVMADAGWVATAGCGSKKHAILYDAMHGNADNWHEQAMDWGTLNWPLCVFYARYHGRQYDSPTGDTHIPGFGNYVPFPVHWEGDGHTDVRPQVGQDKLLSDVVGHPNVGNVWSFQTDTPNDCANCLNWLGWLDIYELTDGTGDPCTGDWTAMVEYGGQVQSTALECEFGPQEDGSFPVDGYAFCTDSVNHKAGSGSGKIPVSSPDSSYFYFRSVTKAWGHDFDQDGGHQAVGQVEVLAPGEITATTITGLAKWQGVSGPGYVGADFTSTEVSVEIVVDFRVPRGNAGTTVMVKYSCHGTGMSSDEVEFRAWLTENVAAGGTNKVLVFFDSYIGGSFSRYEVYYREQGQDTWSLGGSSTSQSTSIIAVQNLDCTKTYDFKARVDWSGQSWVNQFSDSPLASAQPTCGDGGGSPFVAPWNGTAYEEDNNVLPLSEVFDRETVDVIDYYRLHAPLVPRDGIYSLKLLEFEEEHSFIDSVALWAVDHDPDARIGVDPQTGEIFTYEDPESPEWAVDNYGRDVSSTLVAWDGLVYEGWRGDTVELHFGAVHQDQALLVVLADTPKLKTRIYIQVWNGTDWETADTMHHRARFAEDIIDLSNYVPAAELRVRLVGASRFSLDQVGIHTGPPKNVLRQTATLLGANHSSGEDASGLLAQVDGRYSELVPGEEILLTFDIPTEGDEARSFVFVSKGHYVHRYQPLQGTDVFIEGLNAFFETVIPQAPLGEFWDVEIADLLWDLGDGTSLAGLSASYTYAQAGQYVVRIRITYTDGMVKWYQRTILVS